MGAKSNQSQQDPLATFSHRLTQIKYIAFELAIFAGFLVWLWDKVKHDMWPH